MLPGPNNYAPSEVLFRLRTSRVQRNILTSLDELFNESLSPMFNLELSWSDFFIIIKYLSSLLSTLYSDIHSIPFQSVETSIAQMQTLHRIGSPHLPLTSQESPSLTQYTPLHLRCIVLQSNIQSTLPIV